jgi:hypothetical protein
MGSVITHFFWLRLQHEQLADGRKVRFGARSSRSKKLRIAFVTTGSMVDGLMARKGRVAGRGGAPTSGTVAGASGARLRNLFPRSAFCTRITASFPSTSADNFRRHARGKWR